MLPLLDTNMYPIRGSMEEADPSITFRGHSNVVTAVNISASQNRVYSSSLDSTIRVWNLPSEDCGPFSSVGKLQQNSSRFSCNTNHQHRSITERCDICWTYRCYLGHQSFS